MSQNKGEQMSQEHVYYNHIYIYIAIVLDLLLIYLGLPAEAAGGDEKLYQRYRGNHRLRLGCRGKYFNSDGFQQIVHFLLSSS